MIRPSARLEKLNRERRRQEVDALLITDETNVTYLTGFSGDSSYLLCTEDNALLISDGRYSEQIAEECPGMEAYIRATGETMLEAVARIRHEMRINRLGYEGMSVSATQLHQMQGALAAVEFKSTSGVVERLRMRKDKAEIRQIREAVRFAQRAFKMIRAMFRPGETEKDLADQLEMFLRRAGAERSAFDIIVASGAHAALPHARPRTQVIADPAVILVDWGASGRFYKSDLTRLLVVRRIPTKLRSVYEVVLKAQRQAIDVIRPGVPGKLVDAEARAVVEESGFGRFFTHSTGHGVGLEVHEGPALRPGSETILEPGMVVTVEPGVYRRGWGGVRIEDMVLVTRDGHEVLTTLPKDVDSLLID